MVGLAWRHIRSVCAGGFGSRVPAPRRHHAGQLLVPVPLDRFGLIGYGHHPLTARRVAGLVLVTAGVALSKLRPSVARGLAVFAQVDG